MTTIPALLAVFSLSGCIWHEAQDIDAPPWMLAAACLTVCALSALLLTAPTVTAHP